MDWIVFSFQQTDYGIDSLVEITHNRRGTEDDDVTNFKFSVQLKSTSSIIQKNGKIAFSKVPIVKINYWCRGNLPTLFVVYDLNKENFFYRWIDLELINELDKTKPGWRTKESTTISIPSKNILNKETFKELADYVINYKRSSSRFIPPDTYFSIKNKATALVDSIIELNSTYPFESVTKLSEEIQDQLEKAIYKVTITGQTKAGKSTFINALLSKHISSVDFLPLTGIPINFLPGKKEYAEVVYQTKANKKNEYGEPTEEFIKKYVSKNENKGNHLGVEMVNVVINNPQLEYGVCLSDVPGIDDLEERIQNYTWSTVDQSNAILYLIDAFPYEGGGQVFNSGILKDLKRLENLRNIDKVFLLFNKVDRIVSNPIEKLKEHIEQIFDEHEIRRIIHSKIFYISGRHSFELRTGIIKNGQDSIKPVENELWSYILSENKIGLHKIQKLIGEINTLKNNYSDLVELVLSKDDRLKELNKEISDARAKFPEIKASLNKTGGNLSQTLWNYIHRRKGIVTGELNAILNERDKIPHIDWIKNYLITNVHSTRNSANDYLTTELLKSKNEVDNWVEESLQKIRGKINSNTNFNVDLSSLNNFTVENLDNGSFALGLLNFGIVALLALEFPPIAFLVGLFSVLGWTSTAQERKQRKVDKVMRQVHKAYETTSNDLYGKYETAINKNINKVYQYGLDRLNIFLSDLNKEVAKLNALPVTTQQREILQGNKKSLESVTKSIKELDTEMKMIF